MKIRCHGRTLDIRLEEGVALLNDLERAGLSGKRRVAFRQMRYGGEISALEIAGVVSRVRAVGAGGRVSVWCDGHVYEFSPESARAPRPGEHAGDLLSPMPGRVLQTLVKPGDTVAQGQVVMILEAMKMEHSIRAPRDGVVTRIAHGEGDLVDAGVALAEIT